MNLHNGFFSKIKVQFHEVDSMNIVHHSYYIYWMEKARFDFSTSLLGLSYDNFGKLSFSLPVTKLESKYIRSVQLGQEIVVYLKLVERDEAIVTFVYEMRDQKTEVKLFEGRTEHVFINKSGRLLIQYPEQWRKALKKVREETPNYIIEK